MKIKEILSSDKLQEWVLIIFSILWVAVVILDYLNKQIYYIPSIVHFKYGVLFAGLIALGVILSASYTRLSIVSKLPPLKVNGLVVVGLMILFVWSIVAAYNVYWKAPLGFNNYVHLAQKVVTTLGGGFVLTLAAYSGGNLFRSKFLPQETKITLTFALLDIALGFLFYSMLLMLLGAFGLLNQYVVLGILALLILINYKASLRFVTKTLWTSIPKPADLNFWGAFIAFMTLVYIAMNYLYTQAPFPLGFDARNYYVNIPKLISETGYLIQGFQPYAWSLIMATGFVAFSSPEITMFISVLGGLLSLFAIYDLAKNHINISSNSSLLVVLLYLITPTVTNHFIIEFKIDLSLVFIQIVTLTLVLHWIKSKKGARTKEFFKDTTSDRNLLIVVGLLLGFALSVKVLSLFLIVALFTSFWWITEDLYGVIGTALSAVGLIILLGLDDISGLSKYHLNSEYIGLFALVSGIGLLGFSFFKSRILFLQIMKSLVLVGFVAVLTFSPWVYKNYTYTKSGSLIQLILGDTPRPKLDARDMISNYKNSK